MAAPLVSYSKTVLDNGLVILTERMPAMRSVSIGVWIQVGSRNEEREQAGISHFIEHMAFKGTGKRSAEEIAAAIDSVGGTLDAFTSREYTCFSSKVLGEHLPLAVDLLADLLLNARLDPSDIEKEREVILQEIKMVEDAPDDQIHDLFAQTIWADHPLGRPILGWRETLRQIGRDEIVKHMDRYYRPDRVIISAAGDLDHDSLVDLVAAAFGGWGGRAHTGLAAPPVSRLTAVNEDRDLSQVHLCVGVGGLATAHRERYSLSVLNTILGGGMSSRLFQEIREKRGLVYSIFSYSASYRDGGLLVVYAGTSSDHYQEVVDLIQGELRNIRDEPVRPADLRRAKEQLKGNLLLGLESTNSRMTRLAKMYMAFNRCFGLEEIIQGIEEVTPERLRQLTQSLFDGGACALVSIGRILQPSPSV
ncbi:MAG TPA: pitrilysin family protein [Candidatus Methylomirabilis sp.]|nr:pitrilysin family protein [Candidatus Methylomirabilis sp.]